ncbi:hypothetical protein [Candidatus Avelusimicrobium sp.]|uniref:hypothetical protein n=1 Tax=Candidatus Avelusimicrobium sp. TaxID=3048833 RepID=UPI003D7CA8ED
MTKFDDFLEWLEEFPWIGLLVGVLALCGFFRGLHYWQVPFKISALGSGIVAGLLVGLVFLLAGALNSETGPSAFPWAAVVAFVLAGAGVAGLVWLSYHYWRYVWTTLTALLLGTIIFTFIKH